MSSRRGTRRPINIGIEQSHFQSQPRKPQRQIHRHGRFADAAFAARHRDDGDDARNARLRLLCARRAECRVPAHWAAALCAVSTAVTESTPGSFVTASSQALRSGSACGPRAAGTSMAKPTLPSRTTSALDQTLRPRHSVRSPDRSPGQALSEHRLALLAMSFASIAARFHLRIVEDAHYNRRSCRKPIDALDKSARQRKRQCPGPTTRRNGGSRPMGPGAVRRRRRAAARFRRIASPRPGSAEGASSRPFGGPGFGSGGLAIIALGGGRGLAAERHLFRQRAIRAGRGAALRQVRRAHRARHQLSSALADRGGAHRPRSRTANQINIGYRTEHRRRATMRKAKTCPRKA